MAWGTPHISMEGEEISLPTANAEVLFDRYEKNQAKAVPHIPNHSFNLLIMIA